MLKKLIVVGLVSLFATVFTYKLPFITNQTVEVVPNSQSGMSPEFRELLEKEVLSEKEFAKLKSMSANEKSDTSVDIVYDKDIYAELRKGMILWVAILWLLVYSFLPTGLTQYFLSIVFPTLFMFAGLILSIEFVVIASLGAAVYISRVRMLGKKKRE